MEKWGGGTLSREVSENEGKRGATTGKEGKGLEEGHLDSWIYFNNYF